MKVQLQALKARNDELTAHSIKIEDHERILNAEIQKVEKAAQDKLGQIQAQMEGQMTKAFEERIVESHSHMQHQLKELAERLQQEKQHAIDSLAKECEWREQQLR